MTNGKPGAVLVVFNPVKVDEQELRAAVDTYARDAEGVEWIETSPDDDQVQVAAVQKPGVELVLVAGGDGTVRVIASALAGTGVSMGIIPSGTGNLLARNLELDLDLTASVRRAFQGRDRNVDVCSVDLHRPDGSTDSLGFAVMAGLGLDTGMLENTDESLKKHIGPLAYGQGLIRSLVDGGDVRATYSIDDTQVDNARLHTMIFGNCGYLINEFPLFPAAEPDDGIFDVVTMAPRGAFGWLGVFARLGANAAANTVRKVMGKPLVEKNEENVGGPIAKSAGILDYSRGKRASVTLTTPHTFELDGDPVGEVVGVDIEIQAGSLAVRV
ncbi:diacylglycerol kinase family protein [Corynebacterium sp. LK2510]|uniref:diacylglycerol kinase family protein n=1 Tax=Corynebacterium sp. LK2510 TaxID=3110472 RepID=UPI0034CDBE96